jgi:hypothetical protein
VLSHAQLSSLTIRTAQPDDKRALNELAQLDSAAPLAGDVLVAEAGERPLAAIDLVSGRLVADPFRPTASEAALLRARAEQLRARRRTRRGFGRIAGLAR